MDHHCIYAANCVGAGNQKQFLLLLLYAATCAGHGFVLFFSKIFFRYRPDPTATGDFIPFGTVSVQITDMIDQGLVGSGDSPEIAGGFFDAVGVSGVALTGSAVAAVLFVWIVALLLVQCYGIVAQAGTIDRMQQQQQQKQREQQRREAFESRRKNSASGQAPTATDGNLSLLAVVDSLSAAAPFATTSKTQTFACSKMKFPLAIGRSATPKGNTLVSPSEVTFRESNRLPRGWSAERAPGGECDEGYGRDVTVSAVLANRWKVLREEILGDGPWLMWFLPTRAKLAPQVAARVYAGVGDDAHA